MANSKTLIVLDFDHTITDADVDTEIMKLAKDGRIPGEINELFDGSWNPFMEGIFKLLHQQGVREKDYANLARKLPFTAGMQNLLRLIGQNPQYELIIVSDANFFFINTALEHAGLLKYVRRICTNPTHFDEKGCLHIDNYHFQTECDLSPYNICKGRILNEYLKERQENDNVRFKQVIFVGDGTNDFCPAVRALKKVDVAFARKDFSMAKLISQNPEKVQCQVNIWTTGDDIAGMLGLDDDKQKKSGTMKSGG